MTSQTIERAIHVIRGRRVILDEDIAKLYGVSTRRLNEAMKRNAGRFPGDFMYQLTLGEVVAMRSQIATASPLTIPSRTATSFKRNKRYLPRAFTEQGVAMLASVLNSPRAIAVNIEIVRVFVRLRHAMAISAELEKRLALVESKLEQRWAETGQALAEHDRNIRVIFETIRHLIVEDDGDEPPAIGFETR